MAADQIAVLGSPQRAPVQIERIGDPSQRVLEDAVDLLGWHVAERGRQIGQEPLERAERSSGANSDPLSKRCHSLTSTTEAFTRTSYCTFRSAKRRSPRRVPCRTRFRGARYYSSRVDEHYRCGAGRPATALRGRSLASPKGSSAGAFRQL